MRRRLFETTRADVDLTPIDDVVNVFKELADKYKDKDNTVSINSNGDDRALVVSFLSDGEEIKRFEVENTPHVVDDIKLGLTNTVNYVAGRQVNESDLASKYNDEDKAKSVNLSTAAKELDYVLAINEEDIDEVIVYGIDKGDKYNLFVVLDGRAGYEVLLNVDLPNSSSTKSKVKSIAKTHGTPVESKLP